MSHYVYRNLQVTEISKLQLIIALYVDYILADSTCIHSDITRFIFIATRSFHDEKRLTRHNLLYDK